MSEKIKEVKGKQTRIWVLYLKPHSGDKIFSENKELLLQLWDLLESGNFYRLAYKGEGYDFEENKEKFWYPERIKTELTTRTIFLHPNKDRAEKSLKAHELAVKVGIITKKKKKKQS